MSDDAPRGTFSRFLCAALLAGLGLPSLLSAADTIVCDAPLLVANPPQASAQFGWSLSADQGWLAAGAKHDNADSGSVSMYQEPGSGALQTGPKIIPADPHPDDQFGASVSISRDWLAVGAPTGDGRVQDSGVVYLFHREGTTWIQSPKVDAEDATRGAQFGFSVSLSGTTLVVGAPDHSSSGSSSGAAYVFELQGGVWKQTERLLANDGFSFDKFGSSVAVAGDEIVVGAPFADDLHELQNFGAAYVFRQNTDDRWSLEENGKLTAGAFRPGNIQFGSSVAITEGRIVVGARGDDRGFTDSGSAYAFERNGADWTPHLLLPEDREQSEQFGTAVQISGNQVLVGAPFDGEGSHRPGAAYLFEKQNDASWTPKFKIRHNPGGAFGQSVARLGNRIFLGGFQFDVDAATDAGAVATCSTGTPGTPSNLACTKSGPTSVTAGETATYTITVTNDGETAVTGVVLNDPAPEGLTFVRAGRPCEGGFPCALGTIGHGALPPVELTFQVPDTCSTPHSFTNSATVTGVGATTGTCSAPPTTVLRPSSGPRLSCDKQGPGSARTGDLVTYVVTVRNSGCTAAQNVTLFDAPPPCLSYVSGPCVQSPCNLGTIGPGQSSPPVTVSFRVLQAPGCGEKVVNSAVADGSNAEEAACSKETALLGSELGVDVSAPASVLGGTEYEASVLVSNAGPATARNVPLDVTIVGAGAVAQVPAGCAAVGPNDPGSFTCTLPEIGRGGSTTLVFRIKAPVCPACILLGPITVTAKLQTVDANPANDQDSAQTQVTLGADLTVAVTARRVSDLTETDSAVAGANLVYFLKVTNAGPSDSLGGTIHDTLAPGLVFVASPDGCQEANGLVSCPVPPLPAQQSYIARFVVRLPAGATGFFDNVTSVNGQDDPQHGNDTSASITAVTQEADLAVTVSDSPDPVDLSQGHDLLYTVQVTNNGPSDAANVAVKVSLELPEGGSIVSSVPECDQVSSERVECTLAALLVGGSKSFEIHVKVPGQHATATATASVTAKTIDPNPDNDTALETTTLANATDADIMVTQTAGVEAAVAGDVITYTIEVVNRGPSAFAPVRVLDVLPPGVILLSWTDCKAIIVQGPIVICDLGSLEKGIKRLALTVRVDPDFAANPSLLSNRALVPDKTSDPSSANNSSTAETPVLHVAPLILPFFKADTAADVTTLLTVRNPSEEPLGVRLDYFLTGQPAAVSCETQCLKKKQTLTRSLRDQFPGPGLKEGHVGITPISFAACQDVCNPAVPPPLLTPAPVPPLSGDFIRVEPASGHASGQLLVSTDTSRFPPELCRSWSVRFLNGASFGGNTEFFFFVPGNHERDEAVAVGKVYTEGGQFVQEISVTASGETFRRTTQAGFDHGVPLLASFGAIEWDFPQGVVGNVSAIHRAKGGYAVAVPGFCRQPPSAEDLGPEPPLVVPYFEVDPAGATTLFAVRNESENNVMIRREFFSRNDTLQHTEILPLPAHGTRTVNLRDIPGLQGLTQGYIQIGVVGGPVRHERILSGDFVRIDPDRSLASGGALVDTDLQRSSPQLCRRWNVRFLQGEPSGSSTGFVFYIQVGSPGSFVPVTGSVFSEAGENVQNVGVGDVAAFQVEGSAFPLHANGSVEWDLGNGLVGNVASVLRAGGLSVLVPGVCVP